MKIIIIEGLDNTGKTTMINRLMQRYKDVLYIHSDKPEWDGDNISCAIRQTESFKNIVKRIIDTSLCNLTKPNAIILDRSWLGEYVYGCMYRDNNDYYVLKMIKECFDDLRYYDEHNCVSLLLTASPEFCMSHDDNMSLSDNDLNKIKEEKDRFEKLFTEYKDIIYGKSKIINVEGENNNYRPINDIYMEIINIIENGSEE